MAKLSAEASFLDLSDYGRPFATFISAKLKNTAITPLHITYLFGVCGLLAIYFILQQQFILAAIFIVIKCIIDAADGELARVKNTPSYIGRYCDSIFDFILNFGFLLAICSITESSIWWMLLAFFCLQLQGTLYNFYYVILRHKTAGGDQTSKIFEVETPIALGGESQKIVTIFFKIYLLTYGIFDKIIYKLDRNAAVSNTFDSYFMTLVSIYGLGFQLLCIAALLALGFANLVIPSVIIATIFIPIIIVIRIFLYAPAGRK
ncbi:CDP-alcohol phosphatidyltransferase family protein [Flavobacterium ardleyense]|uniref:CDP-alcohol phosphatidyltransferase family protein n=1 Tax=Flavobacterium ardleyense TaxID=2038737 RepID=UPI00298C26C8|nr:CDP-alcohol phosphatidyltransferase family protein [Flavobacterium ardleyense]